MCKKLKRLNPAWPKCTVNICLISNAGEIWFKADCTYCVHGKLSPWPTKLNNKLLDNKCEIILKDTLYRLYYYINKPIMYNSRVI